VSINHFLAPGWVWRPCALDKKSFTIVISPIFACRSLISDSRSGAKPLPEANIPEELSSNCFLYFTCFGADRLPILSSGCFFARSTQCWPNFTMFVLSPSGQMIPIGCFFTDTCRRRAKQGMFADKQTPSCDFVRTPVGWQRA